MPYVKTPWVALKNDDILDAINEVLVKVNTIGDLKAAYTHLSQKANVANRIRDHLLRNTAVGKTGFCHKMGWGIQTQKKGKHNA